jgi:hypothetical protein
MPGTTAAHVTVERPPDLGGLLTRLVVEMDGVRIGRVRRGGSVTAEIPPGRHVFRVRQGWFASEPLVLEVPEGHHITLSAGTGERAVRFTATFRHPGTALDLKLISDT